MGALRVTLALFTLLIVATPALAQQDQLTGTWRFGSADGTTARGGICFFGNVTFDSAGAVTGGTLNECNPAVTPVPITTGRVTVGANGTISGTMGSFGLQGNFLPGGDAFVAVNTLTPSNPTGFGLGVFVKGADTAYAQNDLTGTWRVMLLQGGEVPTQTTENAFGSIAVAANGIITGGILTVFNHASGFSVEQITGGSLSITATGHVGGSIFTSPDGGASVTSTIFEGVLATDKKLLAGGIRTIDFNANPDTITSGLALLQREPSSTFGVGNVAGTWTLNHLIFDPVTATESTWLRGTLTVDANGIVTASSVVDAAGSPVTVSGVLAVDASGFAVGELVTGNTAFTVQGTMFDSKAHLIGVTTLFDQGGPDDPGGPGGVGLLSMAKPVAAAPSAVVQFSAPAYTVTEGTANAVISVVRTGVAATPFTVTFTATPVTAVPGQDFTPVSGILTFASGTLSRTFSVPIIDNTLVNGNRSVLLSLGAPTGDAVLGIQSLAALTIVDNEQSGTVKLSNAAYSVSEAAGSVVVTILRAGAHLAGNVSVSYSTGNGSALSGLDYTATAGTVTFNAGETSKTVSIPILADTLAEGNETFTFTLGPPTGGAVLAAPSAAVITIVDNDAASTLKFSSATYSVSEGAGHVTLTVLRTPSTSSGVLVDFATHDGTAISNAGPALNDFTATSGTLTFGVGNASATITIPIAQDTRAEGNETFTVVLSNARGGGVLGTPSVATVTIVDDESAIQFSAADYVGKEGTPSVITLVRSGALGSPATVTFTATPGTAVGGRDFTPMSTVVSFPANLASKTISVPVLKNPLVQGNRTVLLGLSAPTGGAQLGTRSSAVLTIPEADQGGVIKLSAASYSVAETAGSLAVSIVRVGTSLAGNVSVSYATGNGSALSGLDYTARAGVLTFNAGETSKTVSIPILNDALVDPDETFTFTLSHPTGGATLGTPAAATITITSEDAGGQVRFSAAAYKVIEGAGNASLTVVRSGGTAAEVMVDYATSNGTATAGSDYGSTSGTLTFAAGQMSAVILVPILQDLVAEGDETFVVTLSNARGGASLALPSVATVTIVDDESAIQLSADGYVTREGAPAVITLQRSGALSTAATVNFSATAGTAIAGRDFTPVSTVVSFPANVASKTVTVPLLNNTLVQGNRTVLLAVSGPTGGAQIGTRGTAVLTITEDDQGGVVKLSAAAYTVTESAGSVAVTIVRTGSSLAGNVSVAYATASGTAQPGDDYTATSGTVTFNAGETSKAIAIPIVIDTLVEPSETFTIALSSPTGGAVLGAPSSATITIKDDDVPSQIKLGAASYRVVEGAGNVSITVVRSLALFREVTVPYSTSPTGVNPATPDVDYGAVAGTLTFAANQTSALITIPIVQDSLAEGDETFLVMLGTPGNGAVLGSPSSAVVTITDDESVVQFSQKFIGNMPEVVRSGPATTQITVDFFSQDGTANLGSDYTPGSGTLTFKAGQTAAYIPLLITPDVFAEGPETFTLVLTNPQPLGAASLGPMSSQTFTITDNDFGGTVQFGTAALTASPGESKAIPIVRTGGGGTILTVNWQAISGATSEAFSPTSGTVTFGANETTKSFTIDVSNTDGAQPDVTAVFALSVPPGAANIGATNRSTLTILGARSTVDLPFSVYSVAKGGGPAVVTVQRGGNLDRQVSVAYATGNDTALAGRDYTATSGRLTFAAGQAVATFTVPILAGSAGGQTRSLNLTLSAPSPNTFIGEGDNARLQIREAPVFSYRLVAGTSETVLGFGGSPSINDAGAVAYKALRSDETSQVIRDTAGAKVTIATAGPGNLLGIDGSRFPIDGAGNVVFLGTAGNERQTVFRGAGGALQMLMQTDGMYTELFDPSVSPNGTVAFAAQGESGLAIFTGPGSVGVGRLVAAGHKGFDDVGAYPAVNDAGIVAFVGQREGEARGIFLGELDCPSQPPIAPATGVGAFGLVSLNHAGQVAFVTSLPGPDRLGIQVGGNGSTVTTLVSAASGFQAFGTEGDNTPVVNSLGNVAYEGLTLENFGILTGPDPARDMVVQVGDPLFGSNVTSLTFGGFNAAGQISFLAGLLDGRQVVVVGTPPTTQTDLAITDSASAGVRASAATSPSR